jgi:hypothetical protein
MKPGQLEALDHERDERERKTRKGFVAFRDSRGPSHL